MGSRYSPSQIESMPEADLAKARADLIGELREWESMMAGAAPGDTQSYQKAQAEAEYRRNMLSQIRERLLLSTTGKLTDSAHPTKLNSDNFVDTSGSTGSPVAIGENITQNIKIETPQQKPIRVRPNVAEQNLIWIGKRVMRALFGTLIHSLTGYTVGTTGTSGLALVFVYFAFTSPLIINDLMTKTYLELASFVVLLVALYLGPFLVLVGRDTECEKCHSKFSFYEKERLLTNHQTVGNRVHLEYDTTSTCDECGHTKHDHDERWEPLTDTE